MSAPPACFADPARLDTEMTRAADRLRPYVTWPAWICAVWLIVLARLAPGLLAKAQWIPLAGSVLFLGLPHGAWDPCAWLAVENRAASVRLVAVFLAGYAALAAMYGAFWLMFPGTALAVFIAFSWLHWGQGDAWFARVFYKRAAASASETGIIWLVRGGLPIALPILAFPQAFVRVAQGITTRFGLNANFAALLGPAERNAGLAFLFLLSFLYIGIAWKRRGETARRMDFVDFAQDTGEIALLWALFGTVNSIAAVGVYFGVWHGARHIARLLLTDANLRQSVAEGRVASALRVWAKQSTPIFLTALCLLGGLYLVYARSLHDLSDLMGLYLAYIAALTFPHFALVLWMDKKQGVCAARRARAPDANDTLGNAT